jgi:hypothetical protein
MESTLELTPGMLEEAITIIRFPEVSAAPHWAEVAPEVMVGQHPHMAVMQD